MVKKLLYIHSLETESMCTGCTPGKSVYIPMYVCAFSKPYTESWKMVYILSVLVPGLFPKLQIYPDFCTHAVKTHQRRNPPCCDCARRTAGSLTAGMSTRRRGSTGCGTPTPSTGQITTLTRNILRSLEDISST
jgi:hypothetical protein